MSNSEWIVRGSLLLNVTLVITILTIWYPSILQSAANGIFAFLGDPTERLWALYGLLVGSVTLLGLLVVRDIKTRALDVGV